MTADRSYVLRVRRNGSTEDEYVPIDTFDLVEYECGLRAGDSLRLKSNVDGHSIGELWQVLSGSSLDPDAIWLLPPDGEAQTWENDNVLEDFDKA